MATKSNNYHLSVKELSDEYGKVLEKKKATYSEYEEVRENMQTYLTANMTSIRSLVSIRLLIRIGIESRRDEFFRDITITES